MCVCVGYIRINVGCEIQFFAISMYNNDTTVEMSPRPYALTLYFGLITIQSVLYHPAETVQVEMLLTSFYART